MDQDGPDTETPGFLPPIGYVPRPKYAKDDDGESWKHMMDWVMERRKERHEINMSQMFRIMSCYGAYGHFIYDTEEFLDSFWFYPGDDIEEHIQYVEQFARAFEREKGQITDPIEDGEKIDILIIFLSYCNSSMTLDQLLCTLPEIKSLKDIGGIRDRYLAQQN